MAEHDRVWHGLFVAACAAGGMVVMLTMSAAMLAVRWAWEQSHVWGGVTGIVGVLVFFFILGAVTDWSDD